MEKTPMLYVGFSANFRHMFLALTALFTLIIIVKSLTPALPILSVSNIDKVAHIFAYLALGTVALPAFARVKPFIVWCGLCVFGAGIEIIQGLSSTGRTFDFLDGVANANGALLAVAGWIILTWLSQKFA